MRLKRTDWIKAIGPISVLMILGGTAQGEPAQTVRPGNEVTLNYTCRLANGEIAATTLAAVAEDPSQPKSTVFADRERYEPIRLIALAPGTGSAPVWFTGFEAEIAARLSKAVSGMAVGTSRTVELTATRITALEETETIATHSLVQHLPKEQRLATDMYIGWTGNQPEIGQEVNYGPGFQAEVVALEEDTVTVRVTAKPGARVETAFGTGTIHDRGDHYEFALEAEKGRLIRSGPLVGRIIEIDEDILTIDYAHPFGGEVLYCEVTVESAKEIPEQRSKGANEPTREGSI